MRRTILLALSLVLIGATGASAAPAPSSAAGNGPVGIDMPIVLASSSTVPPPGFHSNAAQAVTAAEHDSRMLAIHRREHPLQVTPYLWNGPGPHWWIDFSYRNHTVAEVDLSTTAHVTHVWTGPLALVTYARGHYLSAFNAWYVVVPFCVLFLLPFFDPRRLRRMVHLDALVLLSFIVSYWLFNHAHLVPAVWAVYPPLLYLLGRMAMIGFGRARASDWQPVLSTRVLTGGLLLLVVARIVLDFTSATVGDVGLASVFGAHRITQGQPIYFNDPGHGDTYGPFAYLAYIPFQAMFPFTGKWDYLPAAHVASLVFDLVTIGGLVRLGTVLRPGAAGRRLGLSLAWVFAACPFTLLGLMVHTNDGLIAMLSVLTLLVFASPTARGVMLGLAAAAKFSPAGLLPLFASPRTGGRRGMLKCGASCVAVVVVSVVAYLPPGGISEFYHRTLGYQFTRPDVFSPWALHPALDPVKTALTVGALLFALSLVLWPERRSLVQVCALAGAVTIAFQLPAVHWFYFYIIWFVPFVSVALLAPVGELLPVREPAADPTDVPAPALEPALAGV